MLVLFVGIVCQYANMGWGIYTCVAYTHMCCAYPHTHIPLMYTHIPTTPTGGQSCRRASVDHQPSTMDCLVSPNTCSKARGQRHLPSYPHPRPTRASTHHPAPAIHASPPVGLCRRWKSMASCVCTLARPPGKLQGGAGPPQRTHPALCCGSALE